MHSIFVKTYMLKKIFSVLVMKYKKVKFSYKLTNLLSCSVSLCSMTSLPLSVIFDIAGFVFPILKSNISFLGNISEVLKGDGRANDVNNNLNNIFNSNKREMLENPESVRESDLKSLKFDSKILNWNDWGTDTYEQWSKNSEPTEINYDQPTIINFQSKNQLKVYLENNLKTILGDKVTNPQLANAEFAVNGLGELLIPITAENIPTTKLNLFSTKNENKVVLKIPSEKISFTPQIEISGTFGPNGTSIKSKSISFVFDTINEKQEIIVFTNDATSKKDITLEDKGISGNKINLWEYIKDEDIYKKLGWTKEGVSLDKHIDGTRMDINMLNKEVIYKDLGIDEATNELTTIKIEFINGNESRNPENNNYNGEYKIIIQSVDKLKNNESVGSRTKRYEVVSSINDKGNTTPLQVNVPNAYLLDTDLDGGKYMYITKEFMGNKSFEMGFKTSSGQPAPFVLMYRNLVNGTILNRFLDAIKESVKTNNFKISNGLAFTIDKVEVNLNMQKNNNIIWLNTHLRKGYKFKNQFSLESQTRVWPYKYNTDGKTNKIKFGVDISWKQGDAVIWGNYDKTIADIINGY